jgi:hypothetical protein
MAFGSPSGPPSTILPLMSEIEFDPRVTRLRELPSGDVLLAGAARFLIDGGEEDAASVLLSCSLSWDATEDPDPWWDKPHYGLDVTVIGPRAAFEILGNREHEITVQVRRAIEAVIPPDTSLGDFSAQAGLLDIDPDWRTELLEIARGRGVHNQAVREAPKNWRNLRFRSESEVRIAQADRAELLFFPNCMARLGIESDRKNREADFLVCAAGKWGILEVDGEPFHPPSRTVHDHKRDRLFHAHGIRTVEHYDASECFERPDEVVAEFLRLLLSA